MPDLTSLRPHLRRTRARRTTVTRPVTPGHARQVAPWRRQERCTMNTVLHGAVVLFVVLLSVPGSAMEPLVL
jgi:hypothetical protein